MKCEDVSNQQLRGSLLDYKDHDSSNVIYDDDDGIQIISDEEEDIDIDSLL